MAIVSIASADTIDLTVYGRTVVVSGTATINTIRGVTDGQSVTLIPGGAFVLGTTGNISASTTTATVNFPVVLVQKDGTLCQVRVVDASTGTGDLVRANSPTIITPTIASFANAQHNHTNAAGGGRITPAAINGTTGTGNVVLASGGTLNEPVVTGFLRHPGPTYDYAGSGTPEGSVAAPVGSTYRRSDGGAGTSFYVKESGGSTNAGWVGK